MENSRRSKIDDFGSIFRFLTPIMLAIFGFISTAYLSSINQRFEKIDEKFNMFIQTYHLIDKRVDRLERKVFGSKEREFQSTSALEY